MSLGFIPILPKPPTDKEGIIAWAAQFTKAVADLYMILSKNFLQALSLNNTNVTITAGSGSPEGKLSASPGSMYRNYSGTVGEYLQYDKKTGTGNTGWVGVGTIY